MTVEEFCRLLADELAHALIGPRGTGRADKRWPTRVKAAQSHGLRYDLLGT